MHKVIWKEVVNFIFFDELFFYDENYADLTFVPQIPYICGIWSSDLTKVNKISNDLGPIPNNSLFVKF